MTRPTLRSLPSTGHLRHLVLVFHVRVVVDEIMRSVLGALEDLHHNRIPNVTFCFKLLTHANNIPKACTDMIPIVLQKMSEFLGTAIEVKAEWIRRN